MGTNYYLQVDCCERCGRSADKMHIGKSSAGWCFSLHVEPDEGISTLEDWVRLWSQPSARIVDEYGDVIPTEEMMRIITKRKWDGAGGLRRHTRDSLCLGHGPGTYDFVTGEFS